MNGATELPYPHWQLPLQRAIIEFDREKLTANRFGQKTRFSNGFESCGHRTIVTMSEKKLVMALSLLKRIKRDELGYPVWQ